MSRPSIGSSKDTEASVKFETSTPRRQTAQAMQPTRAPIVSPKQVIYEAVEALELEATKLRNANDRITTEVEVLRLENDELRQQLEMTKEERDAANRQIKALDEANRRLEAENRRCIDALEKESKRTKEFEEMLKKRTAQDSEELQKLKDALNRKAADLKAVHQEQEAIQMRLEKATKENLDDRSFELLHEVESLKRELQNVRVSKDDVSRTNMNLLTEIKNLEMLLSDRELQLRNEMMRHSLLTTQFNSLMEENAALKEKHHVKAMPRYCDRDGAPPTVTSSSAAVISIQDTNRLQISTLSLKTSFGGTADRSLPNASLCRKSSFSSGLSSREPPPGGDKGDLNSRSRGVSLSRGRSCVDNKKTSSASNDGSVRNVIRRNQTIPDALMSHNQVAANSDESVSSTSNRTLPLLVSNSTKQWKP